MGWEDRPYYRDRPSGGNPLAWLWSGSVHLFTIFGIRVRAHASLIVLIALVLLFGLGPGSGVAERVQSMSILFFVVLLHEFGHCFAARWTGGQADEILLTPLGGLAMAMARRRPWPTGVTVAAGPLVNVLICLLCGLGLYLTIGLWPLGPWQFGRVFQDVRYQWADVVPYLFWTYLISYGLLLFNLLPVFPLDGGQLLQAILWKPLGYYRSMLLTVNVGLVGSILMAMVGIASIASFYGMILLIIAINCFLNCWQWRQLLRAEGPWGFQEEDSVDYSTSLYGGGSGSSTSTRAKRQSRLAKWSAERARKRAEAEAARDASEQVQIDRILAKVSAQGMHSLTGAERRALQKATERQRQRDLETSRPRHG
jgi:Zn-dependent protease